MNSGNTMCPFVHVIVLSVVARASRSSSFSIHHESATNSHGIGGKTITTSSQYAIHVVGSAWLWLDLHVPVVSFL